MRTRKTLARVARYTAPATPTLRPRRRAQAMRRRAWFAGLAARARQVVVQQARQPIHRRRTDLEVAIDEEGRRDVDTFADSKSQGTIDRRQVLSVFVAHLESGLVQPQARGKRLQVARRELTSVFAALV